MATNSTIPQDAILNPYTTLAFMPLNVAEQFQTVCYINIAVFAAYAWDWLVTIPEEYQVIRKVGFKPPSIAYFGSRFATLGSSLANLIFRISPIDNCESVKYVEGILFEISSVATSLLFFFRVKAVYRHSRFVIAFFGFLFLINAGLSLLSMLGTTGIRIPYTRRCTQHIARSYMATPIILTAANDTLVFLAISYRILSSAMVPSTWRARTRSFFTGDGLYRLSKALLKGGQVYYFVTIAADIITVALIFSDSVPESLVSTYFILASAMACRIFRVTLLGIIEDPQPNTAQIASFFRSVNQSDS
ncbi:hypothetical protein PILCRDRAFT_825948 [Piloderma croceum F 1598]|uniref:DUF6533 domain-containing protein n=1 Tax=Piloderma croceum (strain F 1598) TaxID=765440 RepID=A0A0C3FB29_PILCF|nr:hypothetical protein PILCRDRAFT_825948 [Piloderma croceum F 1598]